MGKKFDAVVEAVGNVLENAVQNEEEIKRLAKFSNVTMADILVESIQDAMDDAMDDEPVAHPDDE